jgi:enolase
MIIKSVKGEKFKDSRGEITIKVFIETDVGKFSATAPNGKSRGKFEAKPYRKSIEEDIETLKNFSDYFSKEFIETFDDLRRIEDIIKRNIGANTLIAFEYAALRAVAKEQKKEVWEIVKDSIHDPSDKSKAPTIFPRLVGNCVGGGSHSKGIGGKKPDFQEFLLVPSKDVKENFELNKKIRLNVAEEIKKVDKKFRGEASDEMGWLTSLNEKEILDILKKTEVDIGLDIAASSFFKRKKYHYKNPPLDRTADEQLMYLINLIKNYSIFYVEDPFDEQDFESFGKLLLKFPTSLIVGDDLTVTNYKRLEKAIEKKSINAIIIKPNQNGSLVEVKRVVELCKKKNIKMIFSHRSGETNEDILSDLAFGFQADFIKCGITGPEREAKIKRLVEIEKQMTRSRS